MATIPLSTQIKEAIEAGKDTVSKIAKHLNRTEHAIRGTIVRMYKRGEVSRIPRTAPCRPHKYRVKYDYVDRETKLHDDIIYYVEHGIDTVPELEKHFTVSESTIRDRIRKLVKSGILIPAGKRNEHVKGTNPVTYYITAEEEQKGWAKQKTSTGTVYSMGKPFRKEHDADRLKSKPKKPDVLDFFAAIIRSKKEEERKQ